MTTMDPLGARSEAELEVAKHSRRRRERRLVWPLLLAGALALALWTIARAATFDPLPIADASSRGMVTDVAQDPVHAVEPTDGPLASAKPPPFGPQLEVILPPPPPPPPPPPASSRKAPSASDRTAAAATLTTTQYCDGKYGATSSASTLGGLLAAANAERSKFGLAPLTWSNNLASLAQQWSDSMAGNYDPSNPGAALSHGLVPSPGGQNVAAAWTSGSMTQASAISRAHSGWMASPGHCKNILRASFTSMGAGSAGADSGKAWYTTVDFQ